MKTPAERIAAVLREHGNGLHEPDGPLVNALADAMRRALARQRKECADAVNALSRLELRFARREHEEAVIFLLFFTEGKTERGLILANECGGRRGSAKVRASGQGHEQ